MSKVDALRAIREAKYAASAAPSAAKAAPPKAAPAKAPVKAAARPAAAVEESSELCGHRSMNGRSCTRASGHSEKNHRYA